MVAAEVKSLAGQTGKATEQIIGHIEMVQNGTQSAVAAIKSIQGLINEFETRTTQIAAAVEQQGAATNEIAGGADRAAAATQDVSSNISSISGVVGKTGEAALRVLDDANSLARQTEIVNAAVEEFIADIRMSA